MKNVSEQHVTRLLASGLVWLLILVLVLIQASCGERNVSSTSQLDRPAPLPEPEPVSSPPAERPPRSAALPGEVESIVDGLAKEFPASAESLFAQGQILELYGQSDEAQWCWKESLVLDPEFA